MDLLLWRSGNVIAGTKEELHTNRFIFRRKTNNTTEMASSLKRR